MQQKLPVYHYRQGMAVVWIALALAATCLLLGAGNIGFTPHKALPKVCPLP